MKEYVCIKYIVRELLAIFEKIMYRQKISILENVNYLASFDSF